MVGQASACQRPQHPDYNSDMRTLTIYWLPVLLCVAALAQPKTGEWQSLFDGKTLQGWRETAFTGHGKARVENGTIVLAPGAPMTGVTWSGAFPRRIMKCASKPHASTATISLPASRFRWATRFAPGSPAGGAATSWASPAWMAGTPATTRRGPTSISKRAAGTPSACKSLPGASSGWIDDKQIVNVEIAGRTVGLRYGEIQLSAPFGFASYGTTGALRKIDYRLMR